MTLDEIQREREKDSIIDKTDVSRELLVTPMLFAKWQGIYTDEFRILTEINIALKKMTKERSLYYLGKQSDDVYKAEPLNLKVLRQDLSMFVDSDDKIIELVRKHEIQTMKVKQIELWIKEISGRNWILRNYIDNEKFKNGVT